MIKISLITPSYNQGKYIEKTIKSVLNQHYPNIEYIIIDGGSSDETVEIIKKYEKYITYWISEPDNGQSHAINKGLQHATGEIINWLNSDDYLEPNALHHVAETFNNSNINMLCGFSKLIYSDKIILKRTSNVIDDFAKATGMGHIMQPSTFFRKKIFDELAPVETKLHFMMDHFLWIKYLAKFGTKDICYSDTILANVTVHDKTKSVKNIFDFYKERNWIYSSLLNVMKRKIYLPDKNENEYLPIIINSELFAYHKRKIYFFFLYDQLFLRNLKGERIRIRLKVLVKLFFCFPKETLETIINAFLKK